ncbi:hypothetical protein N1851_022205 [Merluccius polli]|uniref:Endonuclease/exonuclease/phosphatase domain-containing protein n=1 Tax=Merluccius polli TaxID=89951 RepID=A0AA47MI90_MERPO|nr:hypothetical protein N1851_022205 [Merluccius polli]
MALQSYPELRHNPRYSRDALLALRHKPSTSLPPTFLNDIPSELRRSTGRRKRGRRGGIRNRLRRRHTRPPLPSIILSNVRSLNNKIDLRTHASWLQSNAPDSLFEISGFTLIRLNRNANSGKCKGGGICVYINDLWCHQFTVKEALCDSNVEMLSLTLRPFYLPREFGCVLLFVVYVPPSGKAALAAATIADHVHRLLQTHPDAPAIVVGDLNHWGVNFSTTCFTETWLSGIIPDSALQLAGFQLCRADRDMELSGKTKGGGICFYINSGWCNDVTVIQQHCSPDLESFIINCKPFYSPREFASFILVGVYIPPQANVQDAQRMLADQILCVEWSNPDYLVIVLGDFNKGNLTHDLPKYRQVIKCPTRGENILDHCYTTVRDAYHAIPRAALGHSDHVMVHLIPAYRQKLKLYKPVVRTSRKWTSEAVEVLQVCLDSTDWDVFRTATNSLDEYTEAVTSYISFCEGCCVSSRTRVSYNNDQPWFTAKLRRLRLDKEEAFWSGDKDRFKEAKYKFSKAVKEAKRLYSEKLQHQFSANDSASAWKGLTQITKNKPKAPHSINDQRLANDLNEFYCRFERQRDSPATTPHDSSQQLQV